MDQDDTYKKLKQDSFNNVLDAYKRLSPSDVNVFESTENGGVGWFERKGWVKSDFYKELNANYNLHYITGIKKVKVEHPDGTFTQEYEVTNSNNEVIPELRTDRSLVGVKLKYYQPRL
jgi:hypothetical protein